MPEPEFRRLAARWIGWTPVRVWGMVPVERLRRSLTRAGVWDCGPWSGQVPAQPGTVLLLLGDHVYDDALVKALVHAPGSALVRGDGRAVAVHVARRRAEEVAHALVAGEEPPADLPRRKGSELVSRSVLALRKPVPLVMPVSAERRDAVERRLFAAAWPTVTDAVTQALWPLPARHAARACVALGVSANGITLVNFALTALAALLLHAGWLWAGLACAWLMAFLDGVDGALARVTLTWSQVGGAASRLLGALHPPLWWWAFWVGAGGGDVGAPVVMVGGDAGALAVMVGGTLVLRAEELLFRRRFHFDLVLWRRFDRRFRLVAARRNVVLVVLTLGLASGRPLIGFQLAAAWLLASVAVQAVRILQAARLARRGAPVVSWVEG